MNTPKNKMDMARELIKAKDYDAARALLKTVDHPTAAAWITKIDEISPPKRPNGSAVLLGIGGGIVVLLLLAGVIYTQRERIPGIAALFASATPSITPIPTATFTFTPTYTPIPSNTPTATLTPLFTSTPKPTSTPAETSTPIPSPTPQANLGKWKITKEVSSIDDKTNVYATLEAETEVSGAILKERPVIVIRCQNSTLDLFINVGMYMEETSFGSKETNIRLRFDKQPAEAMIAGLSKDEQAIFSGNPRAMISEMVTAKTMALEFSPMNSTPQSTAFDLQGLREAAKLVYAACGLRGP